MLDKILLKFFGAIDNIFQKLDKLFKKHATNKKNKNGKV